MTHDHNSATSMHADHPAHAGPHGSSGHNAHAGHSVAMFRDKFWISLLLTIPTLLWGHMLPGALGFRAPAFFGSSYLPALFGTAVFFYGGLPFVRGAVREIRDRVPGMMTLITLAISVAFVFSIAVTLGYPGMSLWDELSTLIVVMLLGHWIEMRSTSQAQGALQELAKLLPSEAVRVTGDKQETVPLSALKEGDLVLAQPGAAIPADGIVREGASAVNESHAHWRVATGGQEGGRQGHRRDPERKRITPHRGHRNGRSHRARGHHAPRRAGAVVPLARAGTRGSGGLHR